MGSISWSDVVDSDRGAHRLLLGGLHVQQQEVPHGSENVFPGATDNSAICASTAWRSPCGAAPAIFLPGFVSDPTTRTFAKKLSKTTVIVVAVGHLKS